MVEFSIRRGDLEVLECAPRSARTTLETPPMPWATVWSLNPRLEVQSLGTSLNLVPELHRAHPFSLARFLRC